MNQIAVYTAIFGEYDKLHEPVVVPEGVDFVCFTDVPLQSTVWQVRTVAAAHQDPTRNARMYKVLPHRYLGSYEASIWVDGNIKIRGDVGQFAEKYLNKHDMVVYDHAHAKHRDREKSPNPRHSVFEELEALLELARRGRVKDDPELMRQQIDRYKVEGYKEGKVALTNTLLRRHNQPLVKEAMELWWTEIKNGSKRDQLSFPYILWKTGLQVHWIEDNARENEYFIVEPHR